jgi:hypothetical protein
VDILLLSFVFAILQETDNIPSHTGREEEEEDVQPPTTHVGGVCAAFMLSV